VGHSPIALPELETDILRAFKGWHEPDGRSALGYLTLFQRLQREMGDEGEATKALLQQIFNLLAVDQAQYTRLLQLRFLDQMTMQAVANQLNIALPTAYRWQREAISQIAAYVRKEEEAARRLRQDTLERERNLPPRVHLIGVTDQLAELLTLALSPERPWMISIEGLGGIGKTALANNLARELVLSNRFKDIAWVSARQQDRLPPFASQPTNRPALDVATLVDQLLEQLHPEAPLSVSPAAKLTALNELLKASPYFIIIDNLETAIDHQTLLPTLYKLTNPSRFLLTSRHRLQEYSNIHCLDLKELSQTDTDAFLKYEAKIRGISTLAEASPDHLERIYQVVGGNPLALKLVVGQIGILSLSQVLDNLKLAQGKKANALYTHIYWQAWHRLADKSQKVLMAMPLAQDGDFAQLRAISQLDIGDLNDALENLVTLSLVDVSGDLEDRRYRIHRLTETFLLNEVMKW